MSNQQLWFVNRHFHLYILPKLLTFHLQHIQINLQAPNTGIHLESTSSSNINEKSQAHKSLYNPRELQEELNVLNDTFYVYDKKGCWYAIPLRNKRKSSVKAVKKLTVKKCKIFLLNF